VGVAEPARLPLLADALAALGTVRALVVHGVPGLDEISPLGPTSVVDVAAGRTRQWSIDPAIAGFGRGDTADLRGGDPAENAALIEAVLAGGGPPTARAAVVLNAAAALLVADVASDYGACVRLAKAALADGRGAAALQRLRAATLRA
jgi:anthranilate phosphoribosyltransferase